MKASSPAAAALAATLLARFPVEAQPTVWKPSSRALLKATATTRSLNDRVGKLTASFFSQSRSTPSAAARRLARIDRKSTRLNSSHVSISYAVFCLIKTQQQD